MTAYLHAVAGAVPENRYSQAAILEVMKAWHGGDRRTDRLLAGIYRASAIDWRHSVLSDFKAGDPGGFFYDPGEERYLVPSTGQRNRVYAREAGGLAACAGRRSLGRSSATPSGVTHLITVSCTGFFAPGPDIELVDRLGLSTTVERFHLGFMGCYGVFPALRLARSIVLADDSAVVMIVSVELCTLHLQEASDNDALLAASVFADGAAAALVSARPQGPSLRLDSFACVLARDAADEMAWTIGDTGFEMVLSARLPQVVEAQVRDALEPLFADSALRPEGIANWAVHPGGRAILDRVEGSMGLAPEALAASRTVLAEFGNMSSATVLFVLERLLATPGAAGEPVAAVAFGPGLAVESALLARNG